MMKKICIVSASPLTLKFFFNDIIYSLTDSKVLVDVIYNDKIDNYCLPLKIICNKQLLIPIERGISIIKDFRSIILLFYFFKKNKYNLIITLVPKSGLLGMVAGFLSGIENRIHVFQGEVWTGRGVILSFILKLSDKLTHIFSTDNVIVSHSLKEHLINNGIIDNGTVLGKGSICGVDINKFSYNEDLRVEMRSKLNIPLNSIVMIYLGRITKDKGVDKLIKVFESLNLDNLYLLIVGPVEDIFIRNQYFTNTNKKYIFQPYTDEPQRYLTASDFLCLPSTREGFGMVIIEAGSIGLPSIGTNIPGIRDAILDNETGLLYNLNDLDALSKCIEFMYSNTETRILMGEKSKTRIKKYFEKKIVVDKFVHYIVQHL